MDRSATHAMFVMTACLVLAVALLYLVAHVPSPPSAQEDRNICTGYLTDKEYLVHMIPHHQVAVDVSLDMQNRTTNPAMQEILRKLIWTQKYEIAYMRDLLAEVGHEYGMSETDGLSRAYVGTVGDHTRPNSIGLTHTYCDPHFFDPEAHMEHMKHMDLTEKVYIDHMIPHHQVAVDMSKVLLSNTRSDHMIYLAHRIIRSQQEEIVLLKQLQADENYRMDSRLVS